MFRLCPSIHIIFLSNQSRLNHQIAERRKAKLLSGYKDAWQGPWLALIAASIEANGCTYFCCFCGVHCCFLQLEGANTCCFLLFVAACSGLVWDAEEICNLYARSHEVVFLSTPVVSGMLPLPSPFLGSSRCPVCWACFIGTRKDPHQHGPSRIPRCFHAIRLRVDPTLAVPRHLRTCGYNKYTAYSWLEHRARR